MIRSRCLPSFRAVGSQHRLPARRACLSQCCRAGQNSLHATEFIAKGSAFSPFGAKATTAKPTMYTLQVRALAHPPLAPLQQQRPRVASRPSPPWLPCVVLQASETEHIELNPEILAYTNHRYAL